MTDAKFQTLKSLCSAVKDSSVNHDEFPTLGAAIYDLFLEEGYDLGRHDSKYHKDCMVLEPIDRLWGCAIVSEILYCQDWNEFLQRLRWR